MLKLELDYGDKNLISYRIIEDEYDTCVGMIEYDSSINKKDYSLNISAIYNVTGRDFVVFSTTLSSYLNILKNKFLAANEVGQKIQEFLGTENIKIDYDETAKIGEFCIAICDMNRNNLFNIEYIDDVSVPPEIVFSKDGMEYSMKYLDKIFKMQDWLKEILIIN